MAVLPHRSLPVPIVIFGGGAAGLWLLDELARRKTPALLLEANALGQGQTVCSQGILHGGLKYTLQGLLTKSAAHIRDMPAAWRECLAGKRPPQLTDTPLRANSCYLWRTDTVSSRLGMIGAKVGLRVAPKTIDPADRPDVLARCPGSVALLDEQVISPVGLIANLAAHNRDRILKIDIESGLDFHVNSIGDVEVIVLRDSTNRELKLRPATVVLAAGAGNADLRQRIGLSPEAMQRRPLHMVMLRGDLPTLNGHCVDGRRTRVTITSDVDSTGRTVWQVGGQISEDGVALEPAELIPRARAELEAVIPGLDLSRVEWSTYSVDRAEARTPGHRRPETFHAQTDDNVVTIWPTKLVLVPKLAELLAEQIASPSSIPDNVAAAIADWPKPAVAQPPWETATSWWRSDGSVVSQPDAA